MRLLVTGGAGFIGSQYVRDLLGGTFGVGATKVTVLDRLSYSGNRANLASVEGHSDYRFVQGDICDLAAVDAAVEHQDAIVHFAAESHVDRSIAGGLEFVRTNVLGTQTLLDAARRHGVGRFLHVSTDEVYGCILDGSWTEDWPLAPRSPYAASKAASDLMVLAAHRTHGMDVVITRCTNNYGPYQYPEKVIPLFLTNLMEGRKVPMYGDGQQVRDWLHVSDHCAGINLALNKGRSGEIYHIGGGTELTNRELTGYLLDACGKGWDSVETVEDRLGHDRRYSLDISKIRNELGYEPAIDFASGLSQTIDWYRENEDWWRPLKASV